VGSTLRTPKKRQKEHKSECFNPKRISYSSPVYTHFRKCGMEKKDIICEKIFECLPCERWVKESKWIKLIGSLNSMCSVEDLDKTARRRKRYRKQGLIKHNCACGGRWSNSHIRRHQRTKIHRKYVEEEHQKKLIYLQSIENAKKNQEIVTVQKIHYDQDQKKFIKETNVE
tara:strand:- start:9959 stop:10471 length:513 start_codon:yes stop_codon:yes gene_type:complete